MSLDEMLLATTCIDDQAQAQREIGLSGEIAEYLWCSVFQNLKFVLLQISHQSARARTHHSGDVNQIHFCPEWSELLRLTDDYRKRKKCDVEAEEHSQTATSGQRLTVQNLVPISGPYQAVDLFPPLILP